MFFTRTCKSISLLRLITENIDTKMDLKLSKLYLLAYLLLCVDNKTQGTEVTVVKQAKFLLQAASEQPAVVTFFRILFDSALGLSTPNSAIQCGAVCLQVDACLSFYVDDGACVFGVNSTSAFGQEHQISPPGDQDLQVKGTSTHTR